MTTTANNHTELIGKTATVSYKMMLPNIYGKMTQVSGQYRGTVTDTTSTVSGNVFMAVRCDYVGIDPRIENMWHNGANVIIS